MSQNETISSCHFMRAMKIHLKIHCEAGSHVVKGLSCKERHRMNASPSMWTLSSGREPYCKTLQHQAQIGPSLAPWWHTWAPPKALCLVLVFFLTCSLWPFTLGRVMVIAGCCCLFQADFLAPSMFLTPPHLGHGYKWCSFFMSCSSFCSIFSPSPSVSKLLGICLSSAWSGLHGYAMGTEASDWCSRVLNLTSWCSHALNVNKAHDFGWTCGVLWEHFIGDQPATQARCDLCKKPLKYSEDLLCGTHTLLWKLPSVLKYLQQHTCMKTWKVKNSLWIFREWTPGKFGGVGQAFRWHPFLTHLWPYLPKEIKFKQRE